MYLKKNQTIKISQKYALTRKVKERILGLEGNEISEETNKESGPPERTQAREAVNCLSHKHEDTSLNP